MIFVVGIEGFLNILWHHFKTEIIVKNLLLLFWRGGVEANFPQPIKAVGVVLGRVDKIIGAFGFSVHLAMAHGPRKFDTRMEATTIEGFEYSTGHEQAAFSRYFRCLQKPLLIKKPHLIDILEIEILWCRKVAIFPVTQLLVKHGRDGKPLSGATGIIDAIARVGREFEFSCATLSLG